MTICRLMMTVAVLWWDIKVENKLWIWNPMILASDAFAKWRYYTNFCMVKLFLQSIWKYDSSNLLILLRSSWFSSYAKCIQSRWLCHDSLGKYSTRPRRSIHEVLDFRRDLLQYQLRLFECDALRRLLFFQKWPTNTCTQSKCSIKWNPNFRKWYNCKVLILQGWKVFERDRKCNKLKRQRYSETECHVRMQQRIDCRLNEPKLIALLNSPIFRVRAFCSHVNFNSRGKKPWKSAWVVYGWSSNKFYYLLLVFCINK